MKYFVTGATGFIGGRVARQLIEAGHEVIAPVRTPAKAKDLADLGVTVVQGDVTDKESMRQAMTGVDGVFHLAGWYKIGVKDKSMGVSINVDGTRNVLELMKELDIPKGVYTSTLAVNSDTHGRVVDESYRHEDDGHWVSEYDHTKWRAHYEVAEPMVKAGLPLVTVMPGLVYGPGDTSSIHETFVQYLQRKLPMVPEKTTYCWAYVDDIARGHILAMEKGKPGENYIIAGPEARVVEVLALAEKITGVPAPRLHPPRDEVIHGRGDTNDPGQPFVPTGVKIKTCAQQEPNADTLPRERPVADENDGKKDQKFFGTEEHGVLPLIPKTKN